MLLVPGQHPIGQKGHVDVCLADEECLHHSLSARSLSVKVFTAVPTVGTPAMVLQKSLKHRIA
jgi:hypothetical protein